MKATQTALRNMSHIATSAGHKFSMGNLFSYPQLLMTKETRKLNVCRTVQHKQKDVLYRSDWKNRH